MITAIGKEKTLEIQLPFTPDERQELELKVGELILIEGGSPHGSPLLTTFQGQAHPDEGYGINVSRGWYLQGESTMGGVRANKILDSNPCKVPVLNKSVRLYVGQETIATRLIEKRLTLVANLVKKMQRPYVERLAGRPAVAEPI